MKGIKRYLGILLGLSVAATSMPTVAYTPAYAAEFTAPEEPETEFTAPKSEGETRKLAAPKQEEIPELEEAGSELTAPANETFQSPQDQKLTADQVQELINGLPTLNELKTMNTEAQQTAYMEIQTAHEAYEALTKEEQAEIIGAEVFDELFGVFNDMAASLEGDDTVGEAIGETGLCWTLDDQTGTLTISGSGEMLDWEEDRQPWASRKDSIKNVKISEGVTKIGENAFQGCIKLTSVEISDTVTTIKENAFKNCGLTSVTIPDNVTTIGSNTFFGCSNLKTVTINAEVGTINNWFSWFGGCNSLETVAIGAGVKTIGSNAFSGCSNLKTVTIGAGVTTIDSSAFAGTGLTSVTIPNNVKTIGQNAFYSCSNLKTVTINAEVETINDWFRGCNSLETVTIGAGVKTIGSNAFYDCSNLKTVTIGAGVTTIDSIAFSRTGLTSVTIPDNVKTIGLNAFSDCSNLKTVTIGAGVTTIDNSAFASCNSLNTIISKRKEAPTLGFDVFGWVNSDEVTLVIPSNATNYDSWPGYKKCKTGYSITVKVQDNSGGTAKSDIDFAAKGTPINLTATPNEEYRFKKWTTELENLEIKENSFTMPEKDVTVTAVFEAITYTATVDLQKDGQSWINSEKKLTLEKDESAPIVMSDESGIFTASAAAGTYNIYADNEDTGVDITVSEKELTNTATVNYYTVTFDTKGGSAISPQCIASGKKAIKPENPARAGYTFSGWKKQGTDTDWNFDSDTVQEQITLYAKWTYNSSPTYYTLTFNTNGGSSISSVWGTWGTSVDLTLDKYIPTREGYTFSGWYADENLTERITSIKLQGSQTIYAGWTPIPTATPTATPIPTAAPTTAPSPDTDTSDFNPSVGTKFSSAKAVNGTAKVTLSWKKVKGADGYQIYWYNRKTEKYERMKTVLDAKVTTYTTRTLTYGQNHYFKIRAFSVNKKGDRTYGKFGSSVKIKTGPAATTAKTVKSTKKQQVTVTWKKVSNADGYQIYRSTGKNGTYTKMTTITGNKTYTKTLKNQKSGKKYYYKVRAYITGTDGKRIYGKFSTPKSVKIK